MKIPEHPILNVYVNSVQRHGSKLWEFGNKLTRNYLMYFVQAILNFIARGQNEAVGFAYWALFSLFPLIVLFIIIATTVLNIRNGKNDVLNILNQFLPAESTALIRDSLVKIVPRQTPYSIITVLGLIFGASRLFTNLQRSLSRIFGDERPRNWLVQFGVGLVMLITLSALTFLSSLVSTLFKLNPRGPRAAPTMWTDLGSGLILIALGMLLFALLFRYIPRRKIDWISILPAALLGALAWEISRSVFDWYLVNIANLGIVYGSLTAVIGLLTWMFVLGCIISVCAELAVASDDWRHGRPPATAVVIHAVNMRVDQAFVRELARPDSAVALNVVDPESS
jgi:YihY family inner membrane protein